MNITEKDIETAIEEILQLGEKKPVIKKRPGRKRLPPPPVWALSFFDSEKNRTFALISMCIKEDFNQSLPELAKRLSRNKNRPFDECLKKLHEVQKEGRLGYYDRLYFFHPWCAREVSANELEGCCCR